MAKDADGLNHQIRAALSLEMIKRTVDNKIPAKQGAELARGVLKPGSRPKR